MQEISIVKRRDKSVDVARGIAIISIVLCHMDNDLINRFLFTFHIPIFYLISGYYLSSRDSLSSFIKRKGKALLIPYLITSAVIIAIQAIKGAIEGYGAAFLKDWFIVAVLGSGLPVTLGDSYFYGIGPIWFLIATFIGESVLRTLMEVSAGKRILFVALLFGIGYISKDYVYLPLSIQAGLVSVLFMYIGYLFKLSKDYIAVIPKEVKVFATISGAIVWISFVYDFKSFWLVYGDIGNGVVDLFRSICASSLIIIISKLINKYVVWIASFLAFIGRYSLLVLCIHCIEFKCIDLRYSEFDPGCVLLIFVLKMVIIICLTLLLSKNRTVNRFLGLENGRWEY